MNKKYVIKKITSGALALTISFSFTPAVSFASSIESETNSQVSLNGEKLNVSDIFPDINLAKSIQEAINELEISEELEPGTVTLEILNQIQSLNIKMVGSYIETVKGIGYQRNDIIKSYVGLSSLINLEKVIVGKITTLEWLYEANFPDMKELNLQDANLTESVDSIKTNITKMILEGRVNEDILVTLPNGETFGGNRDAAISEAERIALEEAARVEAERIALEEAARVEAERIALEEAANDIVNKTQEAILVTVNNRIAEAKDNTYESKRDTALVLAEFHIARLNDEDIKSNAQTQIDAIRAEIAASKIQIAENDAIKEINELTKTPPFLLAQRNIDSARNNLVNITDEAKNAEFTQILQDSQERLNAYALNKEKYNKGTAEEIKLYRIQKDISNSDGFNVYRIKNIIKTIEEIEDIEPFTNGNDLSYRIHQAIVDKLDFYRNLIPVLKTQISWLEKTQNMFSDIEMEKVNFDVTLQKLQVMGNEYKTFTDSLTYKGTLLPNKFLSEVISEDVRIMLNRAEKIVKNSFGLANLGRAPKLDDVYPVLSENENKLVGEDASKAVFSLTEEGNLYGTIKEGLTHADVENVRSQISNLNHVIFDETGKELPYYLGEVTSNSEINPKLYAPTFGSILDTMDSFINISDKINSEVFTDSSYTRLQESFTLGDINYDGSSKLDSGSLITRAENPYSSLDFSHRDAGDGNYIAREARYFGYDQMNIIKSIKSATEGSRFIKISESVAKVPSILDDYLFNRFMEEGTKDSEDIEKISQFMRNEATKIDLGLDYSTEDANALREKYRELFVSRPWLKSAKIISISKTFEEDFATMERILEQINVQKELFVDNSFTELKEKNSIKLMFMGMDKNLRLNRDDAYSLYHYKNFYKLDILHEIMSDLIKENKNINR